MGPDETTVDTSTDASADAPTAASITERLHRALMDRAPAERTWRVPGHDGVPEALMTLRMPDVTITDGEGRSVVLSPKQSAVVGHYLSMVMDWIDVDLDPSDAGGR
ncbi:hypothetical protein [Actinokineospora spheciospongiae]|uniref:hypothetical protein n=1 Tax=Actinokineospora spheciospongiae TaxID=909613 RepID=UPI0012680FB8|nr:hypothetical protein [Actinokineospora spheciospongiae]